MVREIPLTQGKVTLVDDEDYERAIQIKWSANKIGHSYYACGFIRGSKPHKWTTLHRFLLNPPDNMQVDHINGNGLDNRRCNLRIVTISQNHMNQRKTRGSSKYKGVSWNVREKKWQSIIKIKGKALSLGRFLIEEDAARMYDKAAEKYFGEYARLNIYEEPPIV